LSQAGWLIPSETGPKGQATEAEFTSSSGGVRAPSVNAKKGLSGKTRSRNRVEPGQVAQESFELERIAVTQRVNGCYCAPARNGQLWRFPKGNQPKTKSAERRNKESVRAGKDSRAGKPRQPSKTSAMLKKAPLACERKTT